MATFVEYLGGKTFTSTLLFLFFSGVVAGQAAPGPMTPAARSVESRPVLAEPGLTVKELDGGSVVTRLSAQIAVNEASTLQRRWFVINDATCPVVLSDAGVRTVYENYLRDNDYWYLPEGSIVSATGAHAVEVRFLLFDLWGNHMKTLSLLRVRDMRPGVAVDLDADRTRWRSWENEVAELFTVVAFVANVRRGEREVWAFDQKKFLAQAASIRLKTTEAQLAPAKTPGRP